MNCVIFLLREAARIPSVTGSYWLRGCSLSRIRNLYATIGPTMSGITAFLECQLATKGDLNVLERSRGYIGTLTDHAISQRGFFEERH